MLLYVVLCMYTEGKGARSRNRIQCATRQRRGRMIKVGRRPACACGVWHAARDRVGSCWMRSACRIMWDRHPQTELPQPPAALPLRPRLHRLAANHPGYSRCVCCVLGWPISRPTESLSFPSRRIFFSAPSKAPIACWDAIFPTSPPLQAGPSSPPGLGCSPLASACGCATAAGQWVPSFRNRHRNGLEPRPGSRHKLGRPLQRSWTWILSCL